MNFCGRLCDSRNIFFRLFVDSQKLSDEVHAHLTSEKMSVTVLPYADVATHLASLVCQAAAGTGKIWVSFCWTVFVEWRCKINLLCVVDSGIAEWLDVLVKYKHSVAKQSFNALTLLIEWQEQYLSPCRVCAIYPRMFWSRGGRLGWYLLAQFTQKMAVSVKMVNRCVARIFLRWTGDLECWSWG